MKAVHLKSTHPALAVANVHHEAQLRLGTSGYSELRRIHCVYSRGTATLSGRVSSFYLKQIAQSIVGRLDDVSQVVNELEVDHSHST